MRFTVRRMMGASAVLAVILGLGIEARRLILRYRYCQKMAVRHAAWIEMTRGSADEEIERVRKLEEVESRIASLSARSLDELICGSGDPVLAAWFLKGQRRELLEGGGEGRISPQDLIRHIEHFWGKGWRETARSLQCSRDDHTRMENAYLFASIRPWVEVPPDPPPQSLD